MLLMDELQPLRLYSAKRKVLIPFDVKDKKHGAAIFLMSPFMEQNEKVMNAPYVHNNNLYKSLYIDRDVMPYIDSDAVNNGEETFDELQEAVLSEGMFHDSKTKFVFENASTMDEKIIKQIYNKDAVDYACRMLAIKKCPIDKFTVQFHSNVTDLQKSYPDFHNRTDSKQFYSFTDNKSTIHLLSYIVYNPKEMDGPYEAYARNELLYCIITNQYPTINRKLANSVAIALSGQIEWLRKEKKVEEFRQYDSKDKHIQGLYLADLIYQLYQTKGSNGIRKLLNGDVGVLSDIASGRIIRDTKKLFKLSLTEANLSSKERNELKDSDFGIPSKRKYPMPDAAHVKAAIRMFNHCDSEDEAELAKNIKSKMKKFNVKADIGENNRLSKYIHESIKESASLGESPKDVFEYADDGYLFAGDYSEDYYAILEITKDFSKEEYDRISFYPTYRESKYIEKRIVLRDPNGYPMSFMDVYHFPSSPDVAQITTAVGKGFRGHRLCEKMLQELLASGFAGENGIKKYIWHVHPGNDASEHIADKNGFKKAGNGLDKYGRMTYVYDFEETESEFDSIVPPSVSTESGIMTESGVMLFTEDIADSKYDSKMKRYLYRERIKNKRDVVALYDQIKQRNPIIQKTFRNIKLYNRLNVFIDTSYYHNLYLKNAFKNSKRAYYMYFDFFNRLMENEEVFKNYKKITYYIPVHFTRNGNTVDNLLDIKTDLNIFSLIIYFLRKDPEVLKRWANKEIIFLGDRGYFKIDFANFGLKNFQKFKKNITKLLSNNEIIDDEDEDDLLPETNPKGTAYEVIEQIEKSTGVKMNDVSGVSSIDIKHLKVNKISPNLIDSKTSNAIMILGVDSNSVISMMSDPSIKSKDIKTYYKPKF